MDNYWYKKELFRTVDFSNYNLKKKGFKISRQSDYAMHVFYKVLEGRLTKKRYEALYRIERMNNFGIPVYSEYDCTGQLHHVSTEIYYRKNFTIIKVSLSYDY